MLEAVQLPRWWQELCEVSTVTSLAITVYAITLHFLNYRKPHEQRLVVRIQLIVPVFTITSLVAIKYPEFCQFYLDPVREVYEAFVIYTFFSLLVFVLGGERRIITEICLSHRPSTHAIPFLGRYLGKIDLSYPEDFLMVKRGILQYVWFKPFYCIGNLLCLIFDFSSLNLILVIMYNLSVTWSLYSLAVFWRCLYEDLRPFNPWGKFLCVKVVIFASYWQSMVIMILESKGILRGGSAGFVYQNGLLCIEMVGFAVLHSITFPWEEYSLAMMPESGRMNYIYAIRDCFGGRDLKSDFGKTMRGQSYYNCRNFDPTAESTLVAKADADSRLSRITQGLRFENRGQDRYWIGYGSMDDQSSGSSRSETRRSSVKEEQWDDSIVTHKFLPMDPNYPVSADLTTRHRNSRSMQDLRRVINDRASAV